MYIGNGAGYGTGHPTEVYIANTGPQNDIEVFVNHVSVLEVLVMAMEQEQDN